MVAFMPWVSRSLSITVMINSLECPILPVLPNLNLLCHDREKIRAIQQYVREIMYFTILFVLRTLRIFSCTNFHYYLCDWKILEFEYNYSGKPFLKLKKSGGPSHIDFCVKELIRISLPIQCVEAVFIACRLTAELETIERVPLSFKSVFRYYVYFVFPLCISFSWNEFD